MSIMEYTDYSRLTETEQVKEALAKVRKTSRTWGVIIVLLPIVITFCVGIFSKGITVAKALPIGLGVSVIFLIFNLVNWVKESAKKPWKGVVVDKEILPVTNRENSSGTRDKYGKKRDTTRHEVRLVHVRDEEGKIHTIEAGVLSGYVYDYFNVGDQLRFVPGFPFPYEKRDKSQDTYTICMWCSRKVDLSEETCPRCHKPVIK